MRTTTYRIPIYDPECDCKGYGYEVGLGGDGGGEIQPRLELRSTCGCNCLERRAKEACIYEGNREAQVFLIDLEDGRTYAQKCAEQIIYHD